MDWNHNELKVIWSIVGQQTFCQKVASFLVFLLVFSWKGNMTSMSSSSLRSFQIFIGNETEDGNVKFSMKKKGQYCRIVFCMNLVQLFILSYLATPWKMFPFKNTRALQCFSSTIDENSNTVYLIKAFVF